MIKKQQNYDVNKLLNIDEMIDDLKQMNITFEKMSEEKTKIFLKNNNCYYNIILKDILLMEHLLINLFL